MSAAVPGPLEVPPHLRGAFTPERWAATLDLDRLTDALDALRAAVLAADPAVVSVAYTEGDDSAGTLYLVDVDAGYPRGRYHPDSDAFERVAHAPAVRDALAALTAAGEGTDSLDLTRGA